MDKCDIRIYDKNFNWLGQVSNAESVQMSREHLTCGRFEIHIQPDKSHSELLRTRGNIIILNGAGDKCGIIRDFYMEEDRSGATLVIYGDTGDGLLKQRIIVPPTKAENPNALGYERIYANSETVLKHFVRRNLGDLAYYKRQMPNLAIAPDLGRGILMPWQSRYQNLADEMASISSYSDMGFNIYADSRDRKWIFEVSGGIDRTESQQDISPVTFKMEYMNIGKYRYSEDFQKYCSTGYAGGAGEDEDRLIYTIGADFQGVDRWEVFLECGNAQDAQELLYYGNQKMEDYKEAMNITAESLPKVFAFEQDFFLGDLVTVKIGRLGIAMDTRITGVTEVWERDVGYRCDIRFGSKLPNIYNILKQSKEVR